MKGIRILMIACLVCVAALPVSAKDRKGFVGGFGFGYVPYASTSFGSQSTQSFSAFFGYGITSRHSVTIVSERCFRSSEIGDFNFVGPVYNYFFSPEDHSFNIAIGVGWMTSTFYSYPASTFFSSGYTKRGPACQMGGGYMITRHLQAKATVSIGKVSSVIKKYMSLSLNIVIF